LEGTNGIEPKLIRVLLNRDGDDLLRFRKDIVSHELFWFISIENCILSNTQGRLRFIRTGVMNNSEKTQWVVVMMSFENESSSIEREEHSTYME